MRVRFWGTRGSLPVALTWRDVRDRLARALVAANGQGLDTLEKAHAFAEQHLGFRHPHVRRAFVVRRAAAARRGPDEYFVCDMEAAHGHSASTSPRQGGRPATIYVFMSHMHWDHLMGFSLLRPGVRARQQHPIHGCHEALEHAFRRQQDPPSFPVPFSQLAADIEFIHLEPGQAHELPAVAVTPQLQHHSGIRTASASGAAASRWSTPPTRSTSSTTTPPGCASWSSSATPTVIFDAMYSLAEAVSVKADWGHSSNVVGVELCQMANARRLALFHHEPANGDDAIERILRETRRLEELTRGVQRLEVIAAYDGLEIEL